MSQFYADIQGNRGQATRMGTKNSGMMGHIRGWNVGALVFMDYNEDTGEDECTVSITSGSNGLGGFRELGTFTAADLDKTLTPSVTPEEVAKIIGQNTQIHEHPTINKTYLASDTESMANDLADLFEIKDPQFSRKRFLTACGLK